MTRLLTALAAVLAIAAPAQAECVGANMIDALSPSDRAALQAATDAVPYATGSLWRATKGTQSITMLGTYHLDDPRHGAIMDRVTPMIDAAAEVLVEAGPEEEAALVARMARDPGVMLLVDGPTLPDQLPDADWQRIAEALRARGIPPFMAAKFRPWFLAVTLSIPPCEMENAAQALGLDARVIDAADLAGVPVRALEPYDTVFTIFEDMTPAEQLDMLRSTLAMEDRVSAFSVTLADAYFREDNRLIWEFMRKITGTLPGYTPERVEAEFAQFEEALMSRRNRGWMPVITEAAARGPLFVAFGALHLSGQDGVLALLEREGWQLERLAL